MKKCCLLLPVLLLAGTAMVFAQSNKLIDELLDQKEAGYATTAYMVLSAAGVIPEGSNPDSALAALAEKNWGASVPTEPRSISLGEYSFLLMKAFEIPGGLMYSLIPGPRYAAREVAYLGFVREDTSPYRRVSGEEVMRILGSVLSWKEERQ